MKACRLKLDCNWETGMVSKMVYPVSQQPRKRGYRMNVIVNGITHRGSYYDGIFVETYCGKQIYGRWGKDYDIRIEDKERVTCPECKKYSDRMTY